eukprot:TRINITY_DN64043_c0_g1_i2.p1 TRINITY_DN64043_c0_g1~~TRINITY_DN64043_c0_g1_i2.p1  ORF type:complete len:519 (+),score=64.46 TRINITY_DN64043_c0_g1_i2:16-1572(+)
MGCCQSTQANPPFTAYTYGSKDVAMYKDGVAGPARAGAGAPKPDNGNKKSLLVGINYRGKPFELRGCINDVHTMKAFLKLQNWPSDTVHQRCLTEDQQPTLHPTRQNILEGFKWLLQGARAGDSLFFLFSGHGHQVKDTDGDEIDGKDEAIVPLDFKAVNAKEMITDDLLFKSLVKPLPKGVLLTVIMDCCHSGTILDLPFVYRANRAAPQALKPNVKELHHGNPLYAYSPKDTAAAGLPAGGPPSGGSPSGGGGGGAPAFVKMERAKTTNGGQVILFSGCKDEQTSADVGNVGLAFSDSGELSPGGAGGACLNAMISQLAQKGPNQTYAQLLIGMRDKLEQRGFTQIPQLSTALTIPLNHVFSISASGNPTMQVPGASASQMREDDNGDVPQNPLLMLLMLNGIANGEINTPAQLQALIMSAGAHNDNDDDSQDDNGDDDGGDEDDYNDDNNDDGDDDGYYDDYGAYGYDDNGDGYDDDNGSGSGGGSWDSYGYDDNEEYDQGEKEVYGQYSSYHYY